MNDPTNVYGQLALREPPGAPVGVAREGGPTASTHANGFGDAPPNLTVGMVEGWASTPLTSRPTAPQLLKQQFATPFRELGAASVQLMCRECSPTFFGYVARQGSLH